VTVVAGGKGEPARKDQGARAEPARKDQGARADLAGGDVKVGFRPEGLERR
jgi:hypothetical protein